MLTTYMDGWVRVLRPFNSISVISRRWNGEHARLCAMKRRLGSGRISPPAGFEPATPWSEVGSANRSATRTLQTTYMQTTDAYLSFKLTTEPSAQVSENMSLPFCRNIYNVCLLHDFVATLRLSALPSALYFVLSKLALWPPHFNSCSPCFPYD